MMRLSSTTGKLQMELINIDNMDIDAVIESIEYTLTFCNDSVYRIFNQDGEVMFASSDDEVASQEYASKYVTAEQQIALQIDMEVWNGLQAEDAANRRLSYTV
jgi:shikimate kinase